jgi:hypothetical protein
MAIENKAAFARNVSLPVLGFFTTASLALKISVERLVNCSTFDRSVSKKFSLINPEKAFSNWTTFCLKSVTLKKETGDRGLGTIFRSILVLFRSRGSSVPDSGLLFSTGVTIFLPIEH